MAEITSSLIITLEMDVQVKGITLWDTVLHILANEL